MRNGILMGPDYRHTQLSMSLQTARTAIKWSNKGFNKACLHRMMGKDMTYAWKSTYLQIANT